MYKEAHRHRLKAHSAYLFMSQKLHRDTLNLAHSASELQYTETDCTVFNDGSLPPLSCLTVPSCCYPEWATWLWLQTRWRNTSSKWWGPRTWRRCGSNMKGRHSNGERMISSWTDLTRSLRWKIRLDVCESIGGLLNALFLVPGCIVLQFIYQKHLRRATYSLFIT